MRHKLWIALHPSPNAWEQTQLCPDYPFGVKQDNSSPCSLMLMNASCMSCVRFYSVTDGFSREISLTEALKLRFPIKKTCRCLVSKPSEQWKTCPVANDVCNRELSCSRQSNYNYTCVTWAISAFVFLRLQWCPFSSSCRSCHSFYLESNLIDGKQRLVWCIG